MHASHIQQVRRFNRLITQRTGALETSYLRRGRPLGEARLLFEIGLAGTDIRALRTRLDLNSGYVSRLLRSLESQHLITVRSDSNDARRRTVTLTRKGRAEYTAYEKLSDALATAWLEPLTPTQRDRLTNAMAEVERLITAATLTVRIEPPDRDASRHCLAQYFAELATRFDTGFDPARSNSATEAEMTPPAGYFFIAWIDSRPAGCGALKCNKRGIAEVKRMWTAPEARGLGVARRILHAIETKARDLRLKRLRLETNRTLLEAQSLYRSAGYREVAAFNDEPYAHHWFVLEAQSLYRSAGYREVAAFNDEPYAHHWFEKRL